jgi:L-lactate dehydrogenase (cytochrome)
VPYVLSTAATTAIEDIARIAPGVTWFQLYPARDEAITQDLMQRAARGGVEVLVLTIDVPRSARRHRSIQQRVVVPFRFTPDVLLQIALHPRWALETLRAGPPQLRNFAPYVTSTSVQHVGRVMSQFNKPGLDWSDLKRIRDGWKGRLVAKGIMHPDDAVAAVEAGADGIWVSNHGGRQLPSMPASFDMLESVRRAVPREVPVFLDGGVMSGESVAKALGAGADMVFCGRAFIYGAAAGGKAGVEKAFEILSAELGDTLAQIGCGSVISIREHLQPSARALRAAVGADFTHQEE